MITIEELKRLVKELKEEIEWLRAWQTKAVEDFAGLHEELNEAYERAAQVCDEQESLQYDTACEECAVQARRDAALIRTLKSGEQK